jgi:hypothetical protein
VSARTLTAGDRYAGWMHRRPNDRGLLLPTAVDGQSGLPLVPVLVVVQELHAPTSDSDLQSLPSPGGMSELFPRARRGGVRRLGWASGGGATRKTPIGRHPHRLRFDAVKHRPHVSGRTLV